MRLSRKGFTLIELLGVIAIILILSAITLRISTYVRAKAARTKVEGAMAQVMQGCQRYMADKGTYPDKMNDANYFQVSQQAKTDPWGVAYQYRRLSNNEFVVGSFGPDMRPGIANYDDDNEDRDPNGIRINPYRIPGADTSLWTELGYGDDIVTGDSSVKVRLPP